MKTNLQFHTQPQVTPHLTQTPVNLFLRTILRKNHYGLTPPES